MDDRANIGVRLDRDTFDATRRVDDALRIGRDEQHGFTMVTTATETEWRAQPQRLAWRVAASYYPLRHAFREPSRDRQRIVADLMVLYRYTGTGH